MFTILGGSGFIGGRLAASLRAAGTEVSTPERGARELFERDLGDVIYAVGLTADFRGRPFETVEAHVCLLRDVLERARFRSLLYLSSTRVYQRCAVADETQTPSVDPNDPDDLYNLSKLMGESLCLATGREGIRVVRLSNVYGGDFGSKNFLSEVLRAAVRDGAVRLRSALASAKDYVDVDDVVAVLPKIATSGSARLYNVARGANTSNGELVDALAKLLPLRVEVEERAPALVFPRIANERVRREFDFAPADLLVRLPSLLAACRKALDAR